MKYAVFFKTHKWDSIIETQYERMKESVQNGDLYILYDETFSRAPTHLSNVISITQSDIERVGLVNHGGFWYNGDYGGIVSFLLKPDYDFYVFSEYDVGVYHNLDNIIATMKNENIDVIGNEIKDSNWIHASSAQPYYNVEIEKSLFCIGFFSRRAIVNIYARRLQQAIFRKKHNLEFWPIGEAVMATECKLSNLNYRNLSYFCGNLDNYNWNEPILENYTKYIDLKDTFIHPICDFDKFVKLTFETQSKIDNKLMDKISHISDSNVYIKSYYMRDNTESDKIKIYEKYVENIGPKVFPYINENIISYGCKAYQSSCSEYSFSEFEANRVLNLLPRYHFSMHTDMELNPWWLLDLERERHISNLYIFDRPDLGGFRSINLDVSISSNMNDWTSLYVKKDDSLLWNKKIVIESNARYIKISLLSIGILHLDTIVVTSTEK
ncbi:discoidin domain-containing protein [Acetobacter sp. A11-2]|uniref:discoidin domain-containing protein n=1 Tax=Acetobacter sp. A11-2 TaxID=3157859 RepID=UPI0032EBC6B8